MKMTKLEREVWKFAREMYDGGQHNQEDAYYALAMFKIKPEDYEEEHQKNPRFAELVKTLDDLITSWHNLSWDSNEERRKQYTTTYYEAHERLRLKLLDYEEVVVEKKRAKRQKTGYQLKLF